MASDRPGSNPQYSIPIGGATGGLGGLSQPHYRAYDRPSAMTLGSDSSPVADARLGDARLGVSASAAHGGPPPSPGPRRKLQQKFLADVVKWLVGFVIITSFCSLLYVGSLTDALRKEDITTSPLMSSITHHESMQSEQMTSLSATVAEINNRTNAALHSLSLLLSRLDQQQTHSLTLENELAALTTAATTHLSDPPPLSASALNSLLAKHSGQLSANSEKLTENFKRELLDEVVSVKEVILRVAGPVAQAGLRQELQGELEKVTKGVVGSVSAAVGEQSKGVVMELSKVLGERSKEAAAETAKIGERVASEAAAAAAAAVVAKGEGVGGSDGKELKSLHESLQVSIKEAAERVAELVRHAEQIKTHLAAVPSSVPVNSGVNSAVNSAVERLERVARQLVERGGGGGGGGERRGGRNGGGGEEAERMKGELERKDEIISQLQARLSATAGHGAMGAVRASQGASPHALPRFGGYSFVHFSSHRVGEASFAAVGLGLRAARDLRRASHCVWKQSNQSSSTSASSATSAPSAPSSLPAEEAAVTGSLRIVYPSDSRETTYETVILLCSFPSPVPPGEGGTIAAVVDDEPIPLLLQGSSSSSSRSSSAPPAALPFLTTLCLPPLYGPSILPRSLLEFLHYHRLFGADHSTLYDAGGATSAVRTTLAADVARGRVEIISLDGIQPFNPWNHGQILALHDCLYRARVSSQWVLYLDMDDFLYLPPSTVPLPIPPLQAFLSRFPSPPSSPSSPSSSTPATEAATTTSTASHPAAPTPQSPPPPAVITFGSLWFSVRQCRPRIEHEEEVLGVPQYAHEFTDYEEAKQALLPQSADEAWGGQRDDEFLIERFVFHWPDPACHSNGEGGRFVSPKMCLGEQGHRKFIVDPRKVDRMGVFGPHSEDAPTLSLLNLSTDDFLLLHYRELGLVADLHVCNETVRVRDSVGWWHNSTTYARSAWQLRQKVHCSFTQHGCEDPTHEAFSRS
ncbi:hypothetical protein CLOM_g14337 [Closterium sp. NIES-68]|nr:hypothetical protein CLOM_g14337 [Closterium sp. NIES-68]